MRAVILSLLLLAGCASPLPAVDPQQAWVDLAAPAPGGKLVTYGPYLEDGVPTAASNLAFDASLRAHDPSYGIRRREDVEQAAQHAGLHLVARHAMAANNLLLVFERTGA